MHVNSHRPPFVGSSSLHRFLVRISHHFAEDAVVSHWPFEFYRSINPQTFKELGRRAWHRYECD